MMQVKRIIPDSATKKPKYKNKKVVVKNNKFDSKLESRIYLKILELQKEYDFIFRLQPRYRLVDKFVVDEKLVRPIDYIADFDIVINGKTYVIDVKGLETDVFKIKKKLFAKRYGKQIICVKSVKQFVEWFDDVRKKGEIK